MLRRHGGCPLPHNLYPQGHGSDQGPGGGRRRPGGRDLLQPALRPQRPDAGGDLLLLRQAHRDGPPAADGQPLLRAGGPEHLHRGHHARVPPDGGDHREIYGEPPENCRPVRAPDSGDPVRRPPGGLRPGPGGLLLPGHPLSPVLGGAGKGPTASDVRGALLPEPGADPPPGPPQPARGCPL